MKYEFLKKVPLFAGLSDEDFDLLCEMAEEVKVSAGEVLFIEGSEGLEAFVIEEGQMGSYQKVWRSRHSFGGSWSRRSNR